MPARKPLTARQLSKANSTMRKVSRGQHVSTSEHFLAERARNEVSDRTKSRKKKAKKKGGK